MTRITVIGATGFIGQRLVHRLQSAGYEITVLLHQNREADPFGSEVRVFTGDVTAAETLREPIAASDLVIHLAGCTIAGKKSDFDRVNRAGTLNVAQTCASQPTPPKLLYVSSLAAAGPALEGRPHSESDRPQPVSDYGRSKLAAEEALRSLSDQLPIQVVRPPSVFGDTDVQMLSLFKAAKAGWVFLPGRKIRSYSLIHVDDLAAAMIHLPQHGDTFERESESPRGLFYVAQGPAMTFVELANVIRQALSGKATRPVRVPSPLCWGLAGVNSLAARTTGIRPLLNVDKIREAMAGDWTCDARRLTEQFGFRFQVSLEDSIRATVEGYQEKGWL